MEMKSIRRDRAWCSALDAPRGRARFSARAGMVWLSFVTAGLFTCLGAHSARAQAHESGTASEPDSILAARKHFDLGMQLYREGNARGALIEMSRAYEIAPSPRLLFNIGQTALEAKDYATAYDALSRYLAAEPSDLTPTRRRTVEADLGEASARVGFLVLETDLSSPEATIDGVATPLRASAIPLESGRHELRVTGRDGTTISRFVDISAGDSTRVRLLRPVQPAPSNPNPSVALPPAGSAALPVRAPLRERSPTRPPVVSAPSLWRWTALSATATLGVTGAVLGVVTSSANADHEALLREVPGDSGRIEASEQRVRHLALMTDIALGATLLGAATTLTLFLVDDGPSVHQRQVSVGVGAGQMRVEGAF
jgi:hypothetical protein